MPSQYGGNPATIEASLPVAVAIANTTNASPAVITTSAPHGLHTGDFFLVVGAADPALSGAHLMAGAVTSNTVQALLAPAGTPVAGTIVGGAVGTVLPLTFGTTYQIPSDGPGNPRSAASVNVAFSALGDRTTYLMWLVHMAQHILAYGRLTVDSGGTVSWSSGGEADFESGSLAWFKAGSTLRVDPVLGVKLTGTQPIKTADPGADNIAIATNQCKAWGSITVGNNVFTTNDGFNVASLASASGATQVQVTFARPMANANYAVLWGAGQRLAYPIVLPGDKATTGFKLTLIDTSTFSITPLPIGSGSPTYDVEFSVMARQ